jgi:hypothetical protein
MRGFRLPPSRHAREITIDVEVEGPCQVYGERRSPLDYGRELVNVRIEMRDVSPAWLDRLRAWMLQDEEPEPVRNALVAGHPELPAGPIDAEFVEE